VVLNPERTRERSKCYQCNHLICDSCAVVYSKTGTCDSLARKIDEYFEKVVRGDEAPSIVLPPERSI
jgi:hypothetical protein